MEYFERTYLLSIGQFPSFHFIGSGYPAIIWAIRQFSDSPFAIVIFQQALSLATILCLMWSFKRNPFYFISACFTGVVYLMSDTLLRYEMSIFPDSIIANILIICVILVNQTFKNMGFLAPAFLGIVAGVSILMRSSNVFLIPIILIISSFLAINGHRWRAGITSFTLFLVLLSQCFYNFNFSEGNRFNFLTYGRQGNQDFIQKEFIKRDYKLKHLTESEMELAENFFRRLPINSDLYAYLFSFDPKALGRTFDSCRSGVLATALEDGKIQVCNYGLIHSSDCYELQIPINSVYNTEKLTEILNLYLEKKKDSWIHKRKFYPSYHVNYTFDYTLGQTYYSVIGFAYATSVSKTNLDILNTISGGNPHLIFEHAMGSLYNFQDSYGYNKRFEALKSDPIFRIYDVYNERIAKPILRNYFWLGSSLIALMYFLTIFFTHRNRDMTLILTMLVASLVLLGSSFVFTIFGNPLPRYSFTTEWIYPMLTFFALANIVSRIFSPFNKAPIYAPH